MRQVMSDTPTHADVLAAIDKARVNKWSGPCLDCQACDDERPDDCTDRCLILGADDRNAHCDDLRALIVDGCCLNEECGVPQCAFMRAIVIDRLTGWA